MKTNNIDDITSMFSELKGKKKIMIKFHDNDFGLTMIDTMIVIRALWEKSWQPESFTKELIADRYNLIAPQLYWITNDWDTPTPEKQKHIQEYLRRSPEDILLDDEVDDALRDPEEFWNSESVVFDNSIPDINQQVYMI